MKRYCLLLPASQLSDEDAMIPNLISKLPELTKARTLQTEEKDNLSVSNRLFDNIKNANSYWYYPYLFIFAPFLILSILGIRENFSYNHLISYHHQYNDLIIQKNKLTSDIDSLKKYINKFSDIATNSIHYHIIEKRIFETKKPSVYFRDITLNSERSHFIVKSNSFLDSAIFLRDLKDYNGVYLSLYSTEYWKKSMDSSFESSSPEFEMKINFQLNYPSIEDLIETYKLLSNDQMVYKLSLIKAQ